MAGKVWEVTVSQDMMNILNAERAVIHFKQMGKDFQVRFVGDPYPNTDCRSAMPTLEDYYVFANEKRKRGELT